MCKARGEQKEKEVFFLFSRAAAYFGENCKRGMSLLERDI